MSCIRPVPRPRPCCPDNRVELRVDTPVRAGKICPQPHRFPGDETCETRFARCGAHWRCWRWRIPAWPRRRRRSPCTAPSQFNDDHAFNKSLLKFEELVKKYYGKPINFVLHRNSELGLEKDYFAYMNQGISVDYGIVSPAHMSTFSKAAPFIDAPFLFRDLDALEQGARRRRAQARRRRGRRQGRRDADRLRRRRHAQHLRQQAGAQHGRAEGPEGARAGRADLEQDLRRHRHGADGDRLQRGLQRDPERRHQRRRERGRRASRR